MSHSFQSWSARRSQHTATNPSPLRHASNASTNSSDYSNYSNPFPPSRTSTLSSAASADPHRSSTAQKRSIFETSPERQPASSDYHYTSDRRNTPHQPERQSLRPLPEAPNISLTPNKTLTRLPSPERTEDLDPQSMRSSASPTSPDGPAKTGYSIGVSRSDSRRVKPLPNGQKPQQTGRVDGSELQGLGKSSTGHLKALSRFAEQSNENDFSINSPEQEVVGLHGRRRLQRNTSTRDKKNLSTPGYGGRTWMDQQRQFLQAYEYLCHIGEAKEWIEDVIHKQIAPIVELEGALRDGVTLAEIVQVFEPSRTLRIFRNPKLQFRHSDNIAIFFRFLAEVELPELFRFELVDLYEKKNIPKVIYCIHALSWLLLRKGMVDFRIGNLVGQLEFEHHELEATQKGLDKAGVSMPNFSGMREKLGAEPEPPPPEPVETDEERIDRELLEHEDETLELQAQMRGALGRMRLGDVMQGLWDHESFLIDLQSKIRGDVARQISDYRLHMKTFATKLQTISRGYVVRSSRQQDQAFWKSHERDVTVLQSAFRGRKARQYTNRNRTCLAASEPILQHFQAAIRGAFRRRDLSEQVSQTRDIEPVIINLQKLTRGALLRKQHARKHATLHQSSTSMTLSKLQACIRSAQSRQRVEKTITLLQTSVHTWVSLQSCIRANLSRKRLSSKRTQLQSNTSSIRQLQAAIRAGRQRQFMENTLHALAEQTKPITSAQGKFRGFLQRQAFRDESKALQIAHLSIRNLQAATRGYQCRSHVYELLCKFSSHEKKIQQLQGAARAMLTRSNVASLLDDLDTHDDAVIELQSMSRAKLVRVRFHEKKKFFNENIKKVIQVQSHVRARQQGDAYKSLTAGKNPPVNTVKNFVHLLNDSDFDFDEEVEGEKLRKAVATRIRENEQTEQWIAELDAKIGLLAHNKIARDEYAKIQKHHAGNLAAMRSLSAKDSFNLKALNRNARAKLELYQELFLVLQTESKYLARLFKKVREQGAKDDEYRRLEMLVMSTFGFGQKRREEYYLLRLMASAIEEEARSCHSLQDFQRGAFFFARLFNNYTRAPQDKRYFRDAIRPLIKTQVIENQGLDLESDPIQIYRATINDEELRTGHRSPRNPDLPREQAIKDPQTREIFIRHLQDLRDIVDQFLISLDETLPKFPYGARFVAQQMSESLSRHFHREDPRYILQLVGSWLWRTYLRPVFSEPEKSGAVDRGLDPIQRRNLSEVTRVLGQLAAGRRFGDDDVYLQPLNSYIDEAIERLNDIWAKLIDIPDAQATFDIDAIDDPHAKNPPILYIKLPDIFAMHQMIASNMSSLSISHQDTRLRDVVRDLGSAKNNEEEMGAGGSEIALSLVGKLHDIEDPDADVKALFMETKRCVLYIIRVQAGEHLMNIMVKPITEDDEARWEALVREELTETSGRSNRRHRRAYTEASMSTSSSSNLPDLAAMSYAELKGIALENILELERRGRLTRANNYQDVLNEIAIDIRQKHKRRQQRRKELENTRMTLSALDDKSQWLEEKLKVYNNSFEHGLSTLQNKRGKKRWIRPFSTQWVHERELARLGRLPTYGSFKYSAESLAEKGILVEWKGYGHGQFRSLREVDVTISSDEVNVFVIEGSAGSLMLPGASATFTWDDLLEAQYQGEKYLRFFGAKREDAGTSASSGIGGSTGELVLDAKLFMQQVSKKFWPEG